MIELDRRDYKRDFYLEDTTLLKLTDILYNQVNHTVVNFITVTALDVPIEIVQRILVYKVENRYRQQSWRLSLYGVVEDSKIVFEELSILDCSYEQNKLIEHFNDRDLETILVKTLTSRMTIWGNGIVKKLSNLAAKSQYII